MPVEMLLLNVNEDADRDRPQELVRLRAQRMVTHLFLAEETRASIRAAQRSGAAILLESARVPERAASAVHHALVGSLAVAPSAEAVPDGRPMLSAREREVLALYAGGLTARDVAAALYISRETVLDHLRRMRAKFLAAGRPAPTKIDLYLRAVEERLVTDHTA